MKNVISHYQSVHYKRIFNKNLYISPCGLFDRLIKNIQCGLLLLVDPLLALDTKSFYQNNMWKVPPSFQNTDYAYRGRNHDLVMMLDNFSNLADLKS